MDDQTPRPMRKVHRDIFHRVGKSLGMLEQSFNRSNSSLSADSQSSINVSSPNGHQRNFQGYQREEDSVSLQYHRNTPTESPSAVLRHRNPPLSHQHSSSVSSNDVQEFHEPPVRKSNRHYDQEMQIICQELMEDKPYRLYTCRDFDQKVSLLRIAVSFNTPKVTVPVMLFLENTLSRALFYELLNEHPSAVKNYINLAKLRLDDEHYIAMLEHFGKSKNVSMIRVRQASETRNINNKIALLGQAAMGLQSHPWWYSQVLEYQDLLRKQQELQKYLSSAQPNIQLENQTLLRTYKIVFDFDFRQQRYKRNIDGTVAKRIKEIETDFSMSPEMVMCGHLAVIMKCGLRAHYEDFVQYAMHKGIFSKKYIIAPQNLAEMVYKWVISSGEGQEKASAKAGEYLQLIQDPTTKIYYAEKFQNYDVAMDTVAYTLRDRVQLENLRRHIPQDHPSFLRATQLLENIKWRN